MAIDIFFLIFDFFLNILSINILDYLTLPTMAWGWDIANSTIWPIPTWRPPMGKRALPDWMPFWLDHTLFDLFFRYWMGYYEPIRDGVVRDIMKPTYRFSIWLYKYYRIELGYGIKHWGFKGWFTFIFPYIIGINIFIAVFRVWWNYVTVDRTFDYIYGPRLWPRWRKWKKNRKHIRILYFFRVKYKKYKRRYYLKYKFKIKWFFKYTYMTFKQRYKYYKEKSKKDRKPFY